MIHPNLWLTLINNPKKLDFEKTKVEFHLNQKIENLWWKKKMCILCVMEKNEDKKKSETQGNQVQIL